MEYIIRFWAALIGLLFALTATIITASLGLTFSIILFICALACTPIFYFFPNASDVIKQATDIVTSPLRFAGTVIREVWSQFFDVATGAAHVTGSEDPARVTALTTMLLAFSVACFIGITIAPISNYLTALGYIIASLVVVIVWAAAAIRFSDGADDTVRISAVVIALAVYSATITGIAISSFPLKPLALALAAVGLLLLATIALSAVWEETK